MIAPALDVYVFSLRGLDGAPVAGFELPDQVLIEVVEDVYASVVADSKVEGFFRRFVSDNHSASFPFSCFT